MAHLATSENELIALVSRIDTDLAALDTELDSKCSINVRKLTKLDIHRTTLGTLESQQLAFKLTEAAQTGENISARVRTLDSERSRIVESHNHVSKVLLLKRNLESVHQAMDSRKWEAAAELVHSCLTDIPSDVIEGQLARDKVPSGEHPQLPRDALTEICEGLGQLFKREFDKAIKSRDVKELTRYFKLFPLVDKTDLGLATYAQFVCSIITEESRKLLQGAPATPPPTFYGLIASRLFENIANIVVQHGKIVDRHYGPGHMLLVIQAIQREADVQAGIIADTFLDERRVDRMVSLEQFEDLKHVSDIVGECGMILNRWALYRKFLSGFEGGENVCNTSAFQHKVSTRLLPVFDPLVTKFFEGSIAKAVDLEVVPEPSTKTEPVTLEHAPQTSVVDDSMYILKTVLSQVVSTGVESHVSRSLSAVRKVLETQYIGHVQSKIREFAPRQLAGVLAATTQATLASLPPSEDRRVRFFAMYLNNLGVTADYQLRITQQLPLTAFSDPSHVQQALSAFSTGLQARCDEMVAEGIQQLYSNVIAPNLRSILSVAFRNTNYLTSSESDGSPTAYLFNNGWTKLLTGWSAILLPSAYDRLIGLMVSSLSKMLEKRVWSLNVNEMGAIALDRDVSKIISNVTSNRYKLRDKFIRVAQLVTLVGLDDDEEEEGISWVLSEQELERGRRIRVERRE